MTRAQHVVVIGTEGLTQFSDEVRVHAFGWQEVGKIPNLSDADTVIFNLSSLSDLGAVDWTSLFRSLDPGIAIADVLFHGGRIIFVGDPRFRVKWSSENVLDRDDPFLWWTGLQFYWDDRPGASVSKFVHPRKRTGLENYLSRIKSYRYSLRRCEINTNILSEVFNLDELAKRRQSVSEQVRSLIDNRYGADIAFTIGFQINDASERFRTGIDFGPSSRDLSGELIFLPEADLSGDDSVALLLRDLFDIQLRATEPDWAQKLAIEGQDAFDLDLERIDKALTTLQEEREKIASERKAIRQPLRLLYDIGVGLEDVVLGALGELGATVRLPKAPGLEDGWIHIQVGDDVFEGVLEIKGTRSRQFKEDGLKQVVTWVDRGIQLEKKRYKGIFVGNSDVTVPPEKRKQAFSSGFETNAKLHRIAAITSHDLFRYLELNRAGGLDRPEFWRRLFEMDGIFTYSNFGISPSSATGSLNDEGNPRSSRPLPG